MITEGLLKQRFIDKILTEEAENIKRLQLEIVEDWGIADNLGEKNWNILKGHFGIQQINSGTRLIMRYVKYVRFIEMHNEYNKLRKGFHLYNKVVFGRVYNDTRNRIQWAYSEGMREELIAEIRKSMQELNTPQ